MDFHLLALHMRQELMPALSSKSRQSRDLSGQLREKVLTMLLELGLKHRQVAPSSSLCKIYIKLSIHNFPPIYTYLALLLLSFLCPLSFSFFFSFSFPFLFSTSSPFPFPFPFFTILRNSNSSSSSNSHLPPFSNQTLKSEKE